MSVNRKLLIKNGLLLSLAPFLPKVVSVLLLPVMTNYLTDVDFGISATISAYSLAISAFATLGLRVVIQNSFFKHPHHYRFLWRQIYGFLNVWMVLFAVFQAILLYFVIPEEAAENKWAIILLTNFSTVFFGPTALLGESYYVYSKQSFPIVWRNLLASLITIFSSFVLIVYYGFGYMGWYVSSFIGVFFSNATYWYVVRNQLNLKPIYRFKWRAMKRALSVSAPTIPHYYSIYLLNSSGRMVLDQNQVSQGEIGRLGVAQQIGDLMQTGVTGLNSAVAPFFMDALKKDNQSVIKNLGTLFVYMVLGLGFLLALWSKEVFQLLISNISLQSAYPYFIVYVMSLSIRPMYLVVSSYYFYFEETGKLLYITFISGLLAFALYLIFTPFYGIWAFLIGHFMAHGYFCYSGYFYNLFRNKATIKMPVVQIMFIHIMLTVTAYIIVDYFLVKLVVTMLLVPAVGFLLLKLKKSVKR